MVEGGEFLVEALRALATVILTPGSFFILLVEECGICIGSLNGNGKEAMFHWPKRNIKGKNQKKLR